MSNPTAPAEGRTPLPCPFCGEQPEILVEGAGDPGDVMCSCEAASASWLSVEVWNHRASASETPAPTAPRAILCVYCEKVIGNYPEDGTREELIERSKLHDVVCEAANAYRAAPPAAPAPSGDMNAAIEDAAERMRASANGPDVDWDTLATLAASAFADAGLFAAATPSTGCCVECGKQADVRIESVNGLPCARIKATCHCAAGFRVWLAAPAAPEAGSDADSFAPAAPEAGSDADSFGPAAPEARETLRDVAWREIDSANTSDIMSDTQVGAAVERICAAAPEARLTAERIAEAKDYIDRVSLHRENHDTIVAALERAALAATPPQQENDK